MTRRRPWLQAMISAQAATSICWNITPWWASLGAGMVLSAIISIGIGELP